jgi:hypothetical protein
MMFMCLCGDSRSRLSSGLGLTFPQLRRYLATTHGRNDAKFSDSAKKVYDGLKELDNLLKIL